MEFEVINAEDFTSFKPGHVFPHVEIERLITKIGGGSAEGSNYKQQILKLAGWKYDPIIGYAKHPNTAAVAFNKLREVVVKTQDKDEIMSKLST